MKAGAEALPDDVEALKAALIVARAEAASARAQQSDDQALIAHLKLQIEKLNRDRYAQRSERTARLLDQLELPGDLAIRGKFIWPSASDGAVSISADCFMTKQAAQIQDPKPLHVCFGPTVLDHHAADDFEFAIAFPWQEA